VNISEPSTLTIGLNGTAAQGMTSFDGTATATVSGGVAPYSIQWNDVNGQTGELAVYLNPGWITAHVTDANGCEIMDSIYIGAMGINDLQAAESLIFPNPTTEFIYFKTTNKFIGSSCIIWDAYGRIVRQIQVSSAIQKIEVASLEKGIYFLEVIESEDKFQFVKQ
jgi:hypothetical protein